MNNSSVIAIIGGGFCGSLTLIQLVKQSKIPLKIYFINADNPHPKGIAFSSYNPKHVLNVPAAKMSAFPDEPDHFINWIKSREEYSDYINEELNDRFLPRTIYGKYLEEIFNETINGLNDNISVDVIDDEVIDITAVETGAEILLKKGHSLKADKVVLALGNFNPDHPKIKNKEFFKSENYFVNPWKKEAVEGLNNDGSVLIIGTSLTMVDLVLSLLGNGYHGKIFALSTNGFFPLSHKKRKPYTDILDELHPPYEISKLYNIFRKHIKYVLSNGITGEAVVDAVRPKTQEIWLSLSLNDKIRFMAHLRHLWGVARHRLPKEIFDHMQTLISEKKLEIIGGRIQSLTEKDDKIFITYKERKSQEVKSMEVDRVINCTGPNTDLNKVESPLIANLLKKGLITPDEMRLGINALPDGTIIQKDHSLSTILFTIGSLLKGILWESTAVPELRSQAKSLAGQLIRQIEMKNKVKV